MVHTKHGTIGYDDKFIKESLARETTLTTKEVKTICNLTTRRIISNNITFLSGPHIREIVCSILAEKGYAKERLQYTRIGIPFYDLDKLIGQLYPYRKGITKHIESEYKEVKKLIEGFSK